MEFLFNWLANIPPFAVPYALAALGLMICEKSGVLNLGAEGFLLVGALAGAGAILSLGAHPAAALAVSALAAGALSLVFAVMVIALRVNQVISGLAIVFLAQGVTSLLGRTQGWTSRSFSGMPRIEIPWLSDLPWVGRILFSQDPVFYVTLALLVLATWAFRNTHLGMRLRSVGENPEAADAAGVPVALYRFGAVVLGAALMGVAGGYLTVVISNIWVDNITNGRGWIVIALVIFARWQPMAALAGALLFGGIEAVIPRLAATGFWVPQHFLLMLPYLLTLGVMVWTSLSRQGRGGQPSALGDPFLREERR